METKTARNFDILREIAASGKWVALLTLLGAVGGVAFSFALPKWYSSQLSVIPTAVPKGGGMLASLAGMAAVGGLSDLPIDAGGVMDVDRLDAIFHSTSVTDAVVAKFNLMSRYRERYLEDTRKELWKHCSTKLDRKATLVTLECEERSPDDATAMLVFLSEQANEVARRVASSSAREERKFLEKRVEKGRADLDKASRNLRDFQEANKVISLPEQTKAVVSSIATIRAEMLDKQLQLSYIEGFSSADESSSEQLRRQVGLLKARLRSLEEARVPANAGAEGQPGSKKAKSRDGSSDSIFPPAMNVPKLQYEVEQLYREQKVQETLVLLLTQRYETALVNEARDTPSIQVLDYPVRATKKSRPNRILIAVLGGLLGCLSVVAWIVMRRFAQVFKKSPASAA